MLSTIENSKRKMSDEQIMLAVKNGDLQKMSVLFERYHVRLYNFFYRLNYNQVLSEDLTQNVFERIIRYRHTFKPTFSFKSWIFQIARNVKVEQYKKQEKLKTTSLNIASAAEQEEELQQALHKEKQLQHLEKMISYLSDEQRELLTLTRFQGMKYKDAAQVFGCTEGAIKVKVFRAIKELRKLYQKYDV